jgi:predicted Zn-dependent peptidase
MKKNFKRKILKNGMTILFEKRNVPVVSVAFAVRCGGINEAASEKGISHFIEHMLSKGTPTRNAKKIAEEIEKKGGEFNGFTDEVITAFWCKMPSKHLNVALEVLSDMIKNHVFDKKELEKERQVIFEEMKIYHDNPRYHVFEGIHKSLYSDPFGIPLIGTLKSMNSIDRKKILKRFKEVYQPNNLVLCVVGNANFSKILAFVEKSFGKQKGNVPKFKFKKINVSGVEKRKGIDQANLIFGYHIPLAGDKRSYAAHVLSVIMGGGMSSRLFSEIREKRNLAYSVKSDSDIHSDFAHTLVYVGTKKENIEKVKKIILDEFRKISENLSQEELNQAKDQIIGNHQISMEESQSQMVRLLLYEMNGNAKELYDFEKNIRAVKLEDVKKLARLKKYSFFVLEPSS